MSEQMQSANSFCQVTIAILHNRVSDHCCPHSRLNIFAEQMFLLSFTRYFQWSFMRSRGRVSLIHSRRSKVPPLPWSWSALLASGTYWVSWTSKELASSANHQGASEVPPLPWSQSAVNLDIPQSASANSERTFYHADRILTHLK